MSTHPNEVRRENMSSGAEGGADDDGDPVDPSDEAAAVPVPAHAPDMAVESRSAITLPMITISSAVASIDLFTILLPCRNNAERDRTPSSVLVTVVVPGDCARYTAGDIGTFRREAMMFSDIGGEAILQSTHRPRVADVVDVLENDSHRMDLFVRGLRFIADTHLTEELADFEDAGDWLSIMQRFDLYA